MTSISQKIQEFNALPYKNRLEIVNNIINTLAEKGNTQAQEIKNNLAIIPHPSDHLLETIYTDFENGIAKIKQENMITSLNAEKERQKTIQKLHQKEAETDENPDNLLDLIAA